MPSSQSSVLPQPAAAKAVVAPAAAATGRDSFGRGDGLTPADVTEREYLAEVFALWRDLGIALLWFLGSVLVAGLVLFPLLFGLAP